MTSSPGPATRRANCRSGRFHGGSSPIARRVSTSPPVTGTMRAPAEPAPW
ncbi:MAG: hypothetical protein JNM13_09160 [Hyphomicrobiaceae bacterium]|nr:hypothetical protein [Hyphomicrobiaceae bacterium]